MEIVEVVGGADTHVELHPAAAIDLCNPEVGSRFWRPGTVSVRCHRVVECQRAKSPGGSSAN